MMFPGRRVFGRARAPRVPGQMNKLEAAYAGHLELRRRAGEILSWAYEPMKLRLADRTFLTPDFRVVMPDGEVQFHETKGFMEEDANVKLKVAAEVHPFRFFLVRKAKGGPGAWDITEVAP